MRWLKATLAAWSVLAASTCLAGPESPAIAVHPDAVYSGENVTLNWYFTGTKVVISGGRFGAGVVVTGRTSIEVHPSKTTTYTFDVWFKGSPAPTPPTSALPTPAGAPAAPPKTASSAPTAPRVPSNPTLTTNKVTSPVQAGGAPSVTLASQSEPPTTTPILMHARYTAVVTVVPGQLPKLSSYHDPHGWQMSVLAGWKHDSIAQPDEGSDGQTLFQQEDDSVERVGLAIMPAGSMNVEGLLKQATDVITSYYRNVTIDSPTVLTHENASARMFTFQGMDPTHPGTKTQSIVLLFVRAGRAYVVSGRTAANQFKRREPALAHMVNSLTFVRKVTRDL